MELFTVTARPGVDPRAAVRVIADTNVVAPVLRWLALDGPRPVEEVVGAHRWMQRCATSSLVNGRDVRFVFKWAAIETCRVHGILDGARLARIGAADELLHHWIFSNYPIVQRFANEPPRFRARSGMAEYNDGVPDGASIAAVSFALVGLHELHRERRAGRLRSVKQRFGYLENWAMEVEAVSGFSADLVSIAIQTAFGGDGAPARAVCKFDKYRDAASAKRAAANAAWDLLFLRVMRASESGLSPFEQNPKPTALLTFDRQLAAVAKDLIYRGPVASTAKSTVLVSASNRVQLQREILNDSLMLGRLDDWCLRISARQLERWRKEQYTSARGVEDALDQMLARTFPEA